MIPHPLHPIQQLLAFHSLPFTSIPTPLYHDYTFNNNNSSQNTININVNHLQPPVTPTVTTSLHTLKTPDSINSNSHIPPTPTYCPTNSKLPPDYQSYYSSDVDSFLCNKEDRHRNLPFGDLITSQKDNDHTRLIFQNVNSLELSSGHHTLELMCDSIGQYEVDKACLAETNASRKHPHGEGSFKAKERHWRHSHSTTSETEIDWSDIYKPGCTAIITLPPLNSGMTTSSSDPHELGRWSYITIKGRDHNHLTIISAYRVC